MAKRKYQIEKPSLEVLGALMLTMNAKEFDGHPPNSLRICGYTFQRGTDRANARCEIEVERASGKMLIVAQDSGAETERQLCELADWSVLGKVTSPSYVVQE